MGFLVLYKNSESAMTSGPCSDWRCLIGLQIFETRDIRKDKVFGDKDTKVFSRSKDSRKAFMPNES